jgi:uncharacterized protein YecE (DUF72 family)
LLREHEIGLVIADTAGRFPFVEELTADFVYVRLHGDTKLYGSNYENPALSRWARRIQLWQEGREPRDVYVYFDNDMHAFAPRNAVTLRQMLERKLPTGRLAAAAHGGRRTAR